MAHITKNTTQGKEQSVIALNQLLANMSDLYSQLKAAHWNVKDVNFYSLHLLFDLIADEILKHVDTIAERIVALGGIAEGTIRLSAKATVLPEFHIEGFTGLQYLTQLSDVLSGVATIIRQISDKLEAAGDKTSANFLQELSYDLDKNLFFIESHLQVQRKST